MRVLRRFRRSLKRHFKGYDQGFTNPLDFSKANHPGKNREARRAEEKSVKMKRKPTGRSSFEQRRKRSV